MQPSPFETLPYNTLKAYVMGKTHSGCEVYIPTVTTNPKFMEMKRDALQKFLNEQDIPPQEPLEPIRA